MYSKSLADARPGRDLSYSDVNRETRNESGAMSGNLRVCMWLARLTAIVRGHES